MFLFNGCLGPFGASGLNLWLTNVLTHLNEMLKAPFISFQLPTFALLANQHFCQAHPEVSSPTGRQVYAPVLAVTVHGVTRPVHNELDTFREGLLKMLHSLASRSSGKVP